MNQEQENSLTILDIVVLVVLVVLVAVIGAVGIATITAALKLFFCSTTNPGVKSILAIGFIVILYSLASRVVWRNSEFSLFAFSAGMTFLIFGIIGHVVQ